MMAQRKDMMRIIRQDAAFSAKLGFGGAAGSCDLVDTGIPVTHTLADAMAEPTAVSLPHKTAPRPSGDESGFSLRPVPTEAKPRDEEEAVIPHKASQAKSSVAVAGSPKRGQVVHVALSLTSRQARLAEDWAMAARCTVQFLIRRVAQSLREQVFDDWERDGVPDVDEPRGTRGKHPTSVTLTLRPQFAAALAQIHDPLGLLGLARAMGPAFRARFEVAFDQALAKAKIQSTPEGDDQ